MAPFVLPTAWAKPGSKAPTC